MRAIDADELTEHAMRDRLDSRELIMQMIDSAPTIYIPTWIPCSERMSDKNGWYLLAQAFEWGIEYEGGVWEDGAWWINDNSHVTVAWMPIEPYKEGE